MYDYKKEVEEKEEKIRKYIESDDSIPKPFRRAVETYLCAAIKSQWVAKDYGNTIEFYNKEIKELEETGKKYQEAAESYKKARKSIYRAMCYLVVSNVILTGCVILHAVK